MTTLEERREWMRAGCPVTEPPAVSVTDHAALMGCGYFRLTVIVGRGAYDVAMRARCECGEECRRSMVRQMTHPDPPEPDVDTAIDEVSEWMMTHATERSWLPAREVEENYGARFRESYQVLDWADALLSGQSAEMNSGGVKVPMGDLRGPINVWLVEEAENLT